MPVFDTPIITTDQSLERVLKAGLPVVLLFLNGPVDPQLQQAMQRLAQTHAGELLLVKIQAGENPVSTQRYQVHHTPTLIAYRDGQELSRAEPVTTEAFEKQVAFLLGRGPRPVSSASNRGESRSDQAASNSNGIPLKVTDQNFDEVVMRSPLPVLVDFWAPWCGPCRMTEPAVVRLARENPNNLRVAKVNVDENPHLSGRFGVQSIPTMMIVRDGRVVDRWAGALPELQLRSRLAAYLGK